MTFSNLQANKKEITAIKGMTFNGDDYQQVKINPSSTATSLVAGTPVKIIDSSLKEIIVDICTTLTDKIDGYLKYDANRGAYIKGQNVEMATAGTIIYMEASAAITTGSVVQLVVTGQKIATHTGTNTVAGIAYGKATADEDLIPVKIVPRIS